MSEGSAWVYRREQAGETTTLPGELAEDLLAELGSAQHFAPR